MPRLPVYKVYRYEQRSESAHQLVTGMETFLSAEATRIEGESRVNIVIKPEQGFGQAVSLYIPRTQVMDLVGMLYEVIADWK